MLKLSNKACWRLFMGKRLLQMMLFITASLAIILILISPMVLFNNDDGADVRKLIAQQSISPQRLFISAWRNIKTMYYDPSLNNQDWNKWKYKYLSKIKTTDDVTVAVNTMLASLDDPFSQFFNKKNYELQESYIRDNIDKNATLIEKMKKKYAGCTVQLETIAGVVQKAKVTQNSAFFPNPKAGDVILSINGYNLYGMEMNSAISLIRGTKTYLSKIQILRDNKIITLTIPRGCLSIKKVGSKLLDDNIVQIFIYTFMGKYLPTQFDEEILKYPNAKGYIIDLRSDAGGQALNGLYVAEKLMKTNDNFIFIKYRNSAIIPVSSANKTIIGQKTPIVFLVNEKTASASEILAGSLQKRHRAILVGEPTYGKNAMQQMIPLPNNTCLNLTTSYYSFNEDFDKKASKLIPDYTVKLSAKEIMSGKDTQLEKAITLIKQMNKKQSSY